MSRAAHALALLLLAAHCAAPSIALGVATITAVSAALYPRSTQEARR